MKNLDKLAKQKEGDMNIHKGGDMKDLGKLSKVELRDYWNDEEKDFTPWLAKEENLNLLGEAIGMDLELKSIEQPVSDYRLMGGSKVDILAERRNCEEEHFVVIENQLEKTNHKHLGQLLTYASGLNAKAVVWLAEKINDEHKKALDWLNDNSIEDIAFFGVEIELWQVGDSLPAPRFNVVSQPNGWAKDMRQKAKEPTKIQLLQQEFWTGFVKYLKSKKTSQKNLTTPKSVAWYDGFSMGISDFSLNLIVDSRKNQVGCRLRIREAKQKFYEAFKQKREFIQKELNIPAGELQWDDAPEKSSTIAQYRENSDFQNRKEWLQLFEWLKERAEAFHKVFSKRIQDMDLSEEAA